MALIYSQSHLLMCSVSFFQQLVPLTFVKLLTNALQEAVSSVSEELFTRRRDAAEPTH